ncbi:MAG: TraR/DksA C4-type zinc finger protein [Bacteriovoracaceae bacterium]
MTTLNIELLKKDLLSRKDALTKRIDQLEQDKKRTTGPLSADSEEQAIELQNDEVVNALDELETKELQKINIALKKMDEGTYGDCDVCGEKIAENRLKAVPFATTCINCAK